MGDQQLQPVTSAEISPGASLGKALLALNNEHARELSWLEPARLQQLVEQSFLARRIGSIDAFLLAFDQGADYDSPNYLWFRARYPRFIYVDRIVVAESARGRGLARLLYNDLFARVASSKRDLIACEVNAMPPNPASDRLHAALGFSVVGEAAI